MGKGKNLVGLRFDRLLVVAYVGADNGSVWRCRCDCGTECVRRTGSLNHPGNHSCGCVIATETHGQSKTRLYRIYWNMLNRCSNPKVDRYPRYGGRGITVCPEWAASFEVFAAWAAGSGYEDGLSIDREHNDKNYTPDNCRWVESVTQVRNRSITRHLTWKGISLTPKEWAERLGLSYEAIQLRVTRGWDAERIFTQPFRSPR